MSPPPELPESHTCPFCGLAWTDTPAKSQTNSLKATFWGHVLRDPPNPGEDTSGTFSLQSLMGGTDHQNAPRLLPAPMPWGGGGGKAPLPSGTAGGLGKELVGSWEFKATEAKTALFFLQSLLEPNRAILLLLFTGSKPSPGLPISESTGSFVLKSACSDVGTSHTTGGNSQSGGVGRVDLSGWTRGPCPLLQSYT